MCVVLELDDALAWYEMEDLLALGGLDFQIGMLWLILWCCHVLEALWYPNGLYLYEPFMELPVYYYCMSGSRSVLPYSAIAILFLLLNFASRSSVLSSFYW